MGDEVEVWVLERELRLVVTRLHAVGVDIPFARVIIIRKERSAGSGCFCSIDWLV